MSEFLVCTPSRVHMNLLSMSDQEYRQNGGLGFAIDGFDTLFKVAPSNKIKMLDGRLHPLELKELTRLEGLLESIRSRYGFRHGVSVEIAHGPSAHSGMGVGTALRLSLIESLLLVNNFKCSQEEHISLSKRGGTSGVGVNTYFEGGFFLDVGVRNTGSASSPSSAKQSEKFMQPTVLVKSKMPKWELGIISFEGIQSVSGKDEFSFFEKNTPLSSEHIYSSTYYAFMGVASSIIEDDYDCFAMAVNDLQSTQWKSSEWKIQPSVVIEAREQLFQLGVSSIGLSSFGPTLYVTGNDLQSVKRQFDKEDRVLRLVSPNNVGRTFESV